MTRVICAGVAGLLLLGMASMARAGCTLHVGGDLPLQTDAQRALAKGTVNGQPVVFIVDTGAYMSSMTYPEAKRLKVKFDGRDYSSEGIGGAVGTVEAHMDLKLGTVSNPHEAMLILPMGHMDHDAVGLLGMDLLAQHDIDFNMRDNDLKFLKVQGCSPADLAYWEPGKAVMQAHLEDDGDVRPSILFNVLLNGHLIPAQLDSGAEQSVVTLSAAQAAGADLAGAETIHDIGGIGVHRVAAEVARFDTLTIGDETIKNARLVVSDMWKYNRVESTGTRLGSDSHRLWQPRMLLGADFLRAHHVLIVNSMRLMAFSYQGGPIFDVSAPVAATPSPGAADKTPSAVR